MNLKTILESRGFPLPEDLDEGNLSKALWKEVTVYVPPLEKKKPCIWWLPQLTSCCLPTATFLQLILTGVWGLCAEKELPKKDLQEITPLRWLTLISFSLGQTPFIELLCLLYDHCLIVLFRILVLLLGQLCFAVNARAFICQSIVVSSRSISLSICLFQHSRQGFFFLFRKSCHYFLWCS